MTSAMKVYNKRAPPYAAAVLVELHQVDGNYCVKIRYRNGTGEPHNLSHPGNVHLRLVSLVCVCVCVRVRVRVCVHL